MKMHFVGVGSIRESVECTLHILFKQKRMIYHAFICCTIWFIGSWASTRNRWV